MNDIALLLWNGEGYAFHIETTTLMPAYIGCSAFGIDGHWRPLLVGPHSGRTYYVLDGDVYDTKKLEYAVVMCELGYSTIVAAPKYHTNYTHPYIIEGV